MKLLVPKTLLLIILLSLAACQSASTPTPSPTSTASPTPPATPTAQPGLKEGKFVLKEPTNNLVYEVSVRGQGDTAVLLLNMGDNDSTAWEPLIKALADNGFTTVNFRYSFTTTPEDIKGQIDQVWQHLTEVGHYRRIVCMGGSLGASSCLLAANKPEMIGLAYLAGGNYVPEADGVDLSTLTYPKFFVTGELDSCCAAGTQHVYEQVAEPKTLKVYPQTYEHALHLFESEHGPELIEALVQFVKDLPEVQ
jgi:hypothetical protein